MYSSFILTAVHREVYKVNLKAYKDCSSMFLCCDDDRNSASLGVRGPKLDRHNFNVD